MTREEYLARMSTCRPFLHFGITPQWNPGENDVWGFIYDEVVRQGHNTHVPDDGGKRINWMIDAWKYAAQHRAAIPDKVDIRIVAAKVEPEVNHSTMSPYLSLINGGYRAGDVWIANRKGAPPFKLRDFMEALIERIRYVVAGPGDIELFNSYTNFNFQTQVLNIKTYDDWYLAYEWIHPWPDGNGRSGKILHNWLNGTLHDPVLIKDYWNGGNP